jgi:hypothetical protein
VRDRSDESRRPAKVLGLYTTTPDEPTPRPLLYYPDNNVECRYRERESKRVAHYTGEAPAVKTR